jgi:hypothetical protein
MNVAIFLNTALCSPYVNQCFGGTYHHIHKFIKIVEGISQMDIIHYFELFTVTGDTLNFEGTLSSLPHPLTVDPISAHHRADNYSMKIMLVSHSDIMNL